MTSPMLLELRQTDAFYGTARALQAVSLGLDREPLAIVGRNGMGKTTLCRAVMGLVRTAGSIRLDGREIAGLPPHRIARGGIGYVPQGRRMFPSLSVDEHLRVAERKGSAWSRERVYTLFPRLAERRGNGGTQLSGGEQQMLAIGRALMTGPRLLLMDEPTEGLAPTVIGTLVEGLRSLTREGVAILLVEQNLGVATALADRILVMVNGAVAAEVTAQRLRSDEGLRRRYLGLHGATES